MAWRQQGRAPTSAGGSAMETFLVFLRLGCTSFGGPLAHIAYLRAEFVERRRWIDATQFAEWWALCQALPGPTSSQLGVLIGLQRAGRAGAVAAFAGFTLPSVLLMSALAVGGAHAVGDGARALSHGLTLVALVVVADAVRQSARGLWPDRVAIGIAVMATVLLVPWRHPLAPFAVLAAGLLVRGLLDRSPPEPERGRRPALVSRRTAMGAALGYAVAVAAALLMHADAASLRGLAAACARAGALVFGGAHVVLPLLEPLLVGPDGIARDVFVAGYGAAQAMPGPLFSLAAFLGAVAPTGASPLVGVVVAIGAIYAPGLLLTVAVVPAWNSLSGHPVARAGLVGIRAAAVGLLAAALYDPLWLTGVTRPLDIGIAAIGLGLLQVPRYGSLIVVGWCLGASTLMLR